MFDSALVEAETRVEKSQFKNSFYQALAACSLNPRESKVIEKLIEKEPEGFVGGLNNKKYVAMTKTSPATAKRDLQDLMEKKVLVRNEGGGRSVSYRLNRDFVNQ